MQRKREKTDIANLTLRIEEGLRARIEKFATKNGRSLNAEIIWRLEQSITPVTIGSSDLAQMLVDQNQKMGALMRILAEREGK